MLTNIRETFFFDFLVCVSDIAFACLVRMLKYLRIVIFANVWISKNFQFRSSPSLRTKCANYQQYLKKILQYPPWLGCSPSSPLSAQAYKIFRSVRMVVTTFSPALDSSGFCGSTCFSSTGLFARSVFSCFLKPFPSFLAMARSCSYSSKAILSLLFLLLHVQDSKDVWWFLHKSQIVEILEGYLTIIHRLSWAIRRSSEKVVFELISVMQLLITFQD